MTIKFAIITCSDTRTLETDEAGAKLEELIAAEGWECIRRVVEKDAVSYTHLTLPTICSV